MNRDIEYKEPAERTKPDIEWARAHIPGFAREADRAEAARQDTENNRREMERRKQEAK